MDSDLCDNGTVYYEPFLVGERTFCFTVLDEKSDIDTIKYLLGNVLKLVRVNYDIEINSILYESKGISDERNREVAIKQIHNMLGVDYVNKHSLIRRLFYRYING